MQSYWIVGGALLAAAACFPRASERSALSSHPIRTCLRIYLPLVSWRDTVAPSDHAALRSLELRARFAVPVLLALPVLAWVLSAQPQVNEERLVEEARPAPESPVRPTEAPAAAPDEPPTKAPEPEPLEKLRTPIRLYGTAKVKPIYRAHDVEGARITNIQAGSFWAMVGVQNGDIVIELHGDPIDDPADLVALMNVLELDEHVALRVRGTDGEVRYLEFRNPEPHSR